MAHELLSVKLCELDEKLGRLHSRIQFSQTSDRDSLAKETQLVRRECEEEQQSLSRKLKFSRSEMAGRISRLYEKVEETVRGARNEMENGRDRISPEEWLLLAELNHLLIFQRSIDLLVRRLQLFHSLTRHHQSNQC
mgnify:CR=1 FL=1